MGLSSPPASNSDDINRPPGRTTRVSSRRQQPATPARPPHTLTTGKSSQPSAKARGKAREILPPVPTPSGSSSGPLIGTAHGTSTTLPTPTWTPGSLLASRPPSPSFLDSVGAPPRIAAPWPIPASTVSSSSAQTPSPVFTLVHRPVPAGLPHPVLPLPPQVIRTAPPFPSTPNPIRVYHPANRLLFLALPAFDHLPSSPLQFGCLHETVATACMILAFNRPGYLSTSDSRDRHQDQELPMDSILLPGRYFYHLNDAESDELYPICSDFRQWDFPHGKLPSSWFAVPSTERRNLPSSLSQVSSMIKARDKVCLLSRSLEYLNTAHVVPKEENQWLEDNNMDSYLGMTRPLHLSSQNLFCLQYNFHLGGFDRAQFAIVPKSGQLVVHFLKDSPEAANLYHNVPFDHSNHLSHEVLYARFAWALIKIIKEMDLDPKQFNFQKPENNDTGLTPGVSGKGEGGSGGGGRGTSGTRKRKRDHGDRDGEEGDEEDNGTHQPGKSTVGHKRPLLLPHDSRLSDPKIALGDDPFPIDTDACEIEEDLEVAARNHPFFVDPTMEPTAHDYHNIVWYPGIKVVQRRKQAYFDSHPQIRAHSDQVMQSNSDSN